MYFFCQASAGEIKDSISKITVRLFSELFEFFAKKIYVFGDRVLVIFNNFIFYFFIQHLKNSPDYKYN